VKTNGESTREKSQYAMDGGWSFATGWLIGSGSGRAMIAGNELRFRAASAMAA